MERLVLALLTWTLATAAAGACRDAGGGQKRVPGSAGPIADDAVQVQVQVQVQADVEHGTVPALAREIRRPGRRMAVSGDLNGNDNPAFVEMAEEDQK